MNQTYIVKPGDTLYGISNQYGLSVTELANLNNVEVGSLQIGQVLVIPSVSGTNPSTMFMYTVKAGDTLYKIAEKYNTTVDKIVDLNNLKSTSLSIGQVLKIPEMYKTDEMVMPSYTNYTVKKGDSLYSIAQKYGVTPDIIIKDNALTSNILKIGQQLKIRVMDEQIEECFGPDYEPPDNNTSVNQNVYVVKKGDSLYSIAQRYNTTVSELISLNNLKTTSLSIGQQLRIPSSMSASTNLYTVKSGDTLYSIARKFNTTVDSIKVKNKLSNNLLKIGQQLII